jgi:putative ABC transport system permease protein
MYCERYFPVLLWLWDYLFLLFFSESERLQNAFTQGFARDAQNLISIVTGKTTIAYKGLQSDRLLR